MFKLPELPYAYDALQPVVSEITMKTHHDKHHKAYVDATNKLIDGTGVAGSSLEEVVRHAKSAGDQKLFNQSAQAWNHAFFWESMTPDDGGPEGELAEAIDAAFGGLDQLRTKFVEEGVAHFASGWVWLVSEGGALKVISTHDADTAIVHEGLTPLIVCDVWEHAYYLDYKNVRKEFLEKWFDGVANWAFAAQQLSGEAYRYPAPADQAKAA
jgi:Fe-Mn family superoxide dismutase